MGRERGRLPARAQPDVRGGRRREPREDGHGPYGDPGVAIERRSACRKTRSVFIDHAGVDFKVSAAARVSRVRLRSGGARKFHITRGGYSERGDRSGIALRRAAA